MSNNGEKNVYVKDEMYTAYIEFVRHVHYELSEAFKKYDKYARYFAVVGNRDDGKDALRTSIFTDESKLYDYLNEYHGDKKYTVVFKAPRRSAYFTVDDAYRDDPMADIYHDHNFRGIWG